MSAPVSRTVFLALPVPGRLLDADPVILDASDSYQGILTEGTR